MEMQDKKQRQQLTDVLGISISPARCATHLKQHLVNEDIESNIKSLRELLKNSTDDEEKIKLKSEIFNLSQKIVRISSETSTVMAVICNGFVEDLLKHSINETINNNKKIVDVSNIISGSHKQNIYYSIYYKLPSFINYDPKVYENLRKERTENNKKNKKSKTAGVNNSTDVNPENTVTDTVDTTVVENNNQDSAITTGNDTTDIPQPEDSNKITFNTYIDAILKQVKKNPQYENIKIRISNEVRDYLSNMIIECIKRFVVLSKIIVQQIMGVRTMNSNHIKAIIHMFMKDEGNSDEDINKVINQIDEKLNVYQEHIKSERANKFNELDEATKQQIREKQEERAKNRKKRDIVIAEKRAADAAARVKKLTEEINT